MPYKIAGEHFSTKNDIRIRCRAILNSTSDNEPVNSDDATFLLELFQKLDNWLDKAGEGVVRITARTTTYGNRCFMLQRADGSTTEVSSGAAIKVV